MCVCVCVVCVDVKLRIGWRDEVVMDDGWWDGCRGWWNKKLEGCLMLVELEIVIGGSCCNIDNSWEGFCRKRMGWRGY